MAECNQWIEILKLLPLYGAGGWALYKYREDQRWKQQQFATTLFRDFANKSTAKKAMMMLDWTRGIELFPEKEGKDRMERIGADDLVGALQVEREGPFSPKEVRIRDIFDEFFSDLAEFDHHIKSGLISVEQISP